MNSLHLISHHMFVAALDASGRRPDRSARRERPIDSRARPEPGKPPEGATAGFKPLPLPRLGPRLGEI
jgi:hypothetical protein